MTSVQIIWSCSIAAILLAMAIAAVCSGHFHPLRYLSRHHIIEIENYDFMYDDDDCDE